MVQELVREVKSKWLIKPEVTEVTDEESSEEASEESTEETTEETPEEETEEVDEPAEDADEESEDETVEETTEDDEEDEPEYEEVIEYRPNPKKHKIELTQSNSYNGFPDGKDRLKVSKKRIRKLNKRDKEIYETREIKNAFEELIYKARDWVYDEEN